MKGRPLPRGAGTSSAPALAGGKRSPASRSQTRSGVAAEFRATGHTTLLPLAVRSAASQHIMRRHQDALSRNTAAQNMLDLRLYP